MKFLNFILNTIKKYWYLCVIFSLTGLILVVGFSGNSKLVQLVKLLGSTAQNYQKRVDTIDKLAGKKSEKDKKAIDTYEKKSKQIEDNKQKQLEKEGTRKLKLVKKLKDESSEELAKKMKDEFKL